MPEWRQPLLQRLRGLALSPEREMEIIEELSLHLDARVEELLRDGISTAEASAAALAELDAGGLRRRLANLRQARTPPTIVAGARRRSFAPDLGRDIRLALRALRSKPAFSTVAILTLALGLGANTAIFSVVHAVLLRPLPFHEPDRLVLIWNTRPERPLDSLTPGRMIDFRDRAKSFDKFAAISHIPLTLTGTGTPERLMGSSVSAPFFDVLGVQSLHGRVFTPGGEQERVAVLTHRLWTRLFGGDPGIVGRTITLNTKPHVVIGVMPREFVWPAITVRAASGFEPDLWVAAGPTGVPDTPIATGEEIAANRRIGYVRAVARLRTDVSLEEARAEIGAIASTLQQEHPQTDAQRGGTVVDLRRHLLGSAREPLMLLLGAVAFVLVIACANVANLMMGRAASRRREFKMRLALGAGRGRLIQQLLVESGVIAVAGGAVGVLLAWWALDGLVRAVPEGVLRLEQTSLSAPVLAFSFLLSALTAIVFGILPALQAARLEGRLGLRDDARTIGARGGARSRAVIVAAEVAVAVALVIGATLLVRSFASLQRVDVGLDVDRLLTFDLHLSGERAEYQAQQVAFYERVLERVRAIPGVSAAGMAVTLPIGGDDFGAPVTINGRPLPPEGQEASAGLQMVSPGYFEAAGMDIIAGRDVALTDTRARQPVAVVNQAFAARHWPGESALGKRFRVGRDLSQPAIEVIGIVENIRHLGPKAPPRTEFYQPYSQVSFSFMSVLVRTEGDPGALAAPIRAAVAAIDPLQPVAGLMPMKQHLHNALAQPRFLSGLTSLFGGLALLLAAIGIYGVMAWSVTVRTKEFGVRLALGARPAVLLRQVWKEGILVVMAGAAAGLAIAAGLSQTIASLLFETPAIEPLAYVVAVGLVMAAATLAIVVPARRATRVDPIQALRAD